MTRPKVPLAEALLQLMKKEGRTSIDIGSFGLLDEAYELAYGEGNNGTRTRAAHPMNKHRAVMEAVARSPKFRRAGRIRHCYGTGGQERLHPIFNVVEAE